MRLLHLVPSPGCACWSWPTRKATICGKLLADMGADVVKIEPPGGDAARRVGPFVDDRPHPDRSLFFWHYNTNKRGVTLNLGLPEGQEIFRLLAHTADIVLETFKPGYLPAVGLGYEALREENPGLIMASLTPFGQTGPYRDFVTSDLVSLALGGPMASCGYDDLPGAPPIRGEGHQAFHTGSHYAFVGILVALYWRDLAGEGQYIDASIHEACSSTTEGAFPSYVLPRYRGPSPNGTPRRHDPHAALAFSMQGREIRQPDRRDAARRGRLAQLLGAGWTAKAWWGT